MALIAQGVSHDAAAAGDPRPYRGRGLIEVLNELRDGGLPLIFSSAVVGDDIRVTLEPVAGEPLSLLREILEPLGLKLATGPGNSLLILPRVQGTGRIRGRILSQREDLPVRRAWIRVEGTSLRARTVLDGSFELDGVPSGATNLTLEAFGYETAAVPVRVTTGEVTRLTLRLVAKASYATEVLVTPSRRSIQQHELSPGRDLGQDDALLIPAIGGDANRVIDLLPGVASADNSAAFHVRGSLQTDVAIVVDGLELYDPFHLRSFQSPFGLVDGQIVDRIDFLGGGFTVDRGDRHGGFVDISTIQPDDRAGGVAALGTLNSRVSYGGRLNGRRAASWLFSVRGWYPEAESEAIKLGGGERLDPRFFDAYGKLSLVLTPRLLLSFHGLVAFDRIEFVEPSVETGSAPEEANVLTRNGYGWLRLQHLWSPSVTSETLLSAGRIERRRGGASSSGPEDTVVVNDDRVFNFLGIKHDSTWQISDSHAVRAGFEIRQLNTWYRYSTVGSGSSTSLIDVAPDGIAYGLYASHRTRLSSNLTAELGLRWDRQSYTHEDQLNPRINAGWKLNERSELLFALGRFSQSQRIHELRVEDGEETFLPAELSDQAELTFKHELPGGLRFRVDAFYRELSRVQPRSENLFEPIELFPEIRSDRVLVAPDSARQRGVELLLRGASASPLTWWVSYARSEAEDVIDGRRVPRSWDQPHSAKFLIGYRFADHWTASLSGTAHSGWPTTPLTGRVVTAPGEARRIERVLGPRNSDRFPHYSRLDARVSGSFEVTDGRLGLTVEVGNLTNHANRCCVDEFLLSALPDGGVAVDRRYDSWLGFTPSFSVFWEF